MDSREKKRVLITFAALIVGVILLAIVTRMWLESSGLKDQYVNTNVVKANPPSISKTVEPETLEILSPIQL